MGARMSDDELATALTSLFAVGDPVPDASRAAASAALSWRDMDAQLAALTSDSLAGAGAATVRGTPPRLLSFATDTISIDLEITDEGETIRILGQLAPPQGSQVSIEFEGGRRTVTADHLGRFSFEALPAGWLRVVVHSDDTGAQRSHTEWLHI